MVKRLGEIYLGGHAEPNRSLLHGDFYPGSWLKTADGFRVIDPEFCFCGPVEFDLGVLCAHWIFCHASPESGTIENVCNNYGNGPSIPLVCGFAGVELIRRLIGVAQLPLSADLDLRQTWLSLGEQLVMQSRSAIM